MTGAKGITIPVVGVVTEVTVALVPVRPELEALTVIGPPVVLARNRIVAIPACAAMGLFPISVPDPEVMEKVMGVVAEGTTVPMESSTEA